MWLDLTTSHRQSGSSAPHQRITDSTDLLTARGVAHLVVHGTTGSTSYEIRFHTSDWRAVEACCRPWTWWCNDATDLAGYATMTMMMMMSSCISIGEYLRLPDHPHIAYIWVSSVWAIEAAMIEYHTTRYNTIRDAIIKCARKPI